ncbi:MAG: hypothetical protein K0Q70_1766, partial [Rhodospirillales bacterium]|nr:hypothetical protein [Rhodospirillales bacterium]
MKVTAKFAVPALALLLLAGFPTAQAWAAMEDDQYDVPYVPT